MNVSQEFLRQVILEKLSAAIEKTRKIDEMLFASTEETETKLWRLSRDASLILEDLKEGLNVSEVTHESDE